MPLFPELEDSSPTLARTLDALHAKPVYLAKQKRWIIEIPVDEIEPCLECGSIYIRFHIRYATYSKKEQCWKIGHVKHKEAWYL